MSAPTPVAPTYLAGKYGSVVAGTIILPHMTFSVSETAGTFDATNGTTGGYDFMESSNQGATVTFDVCWKKSSGAPPIRKGSVYLMHFNTQQVSGGTSTPVYEGYTGNVLITGISTSSTVKGETKWSGSGTFQGVYDSPEYPTARADFAAQTGDFAPPT